MDIGNRSPSEGGYYIAVDRRGFLSLATAAATTALWLPETMNATDSASASGFVKPKYPNSVIWNLTNKAPRVAWTVDDGASEVALRNYIDFLHKTGTRLTFFVVANNRPWRNLRRELLPLVRSGQVQLANHTKSHPDLTKLQGWQIRRELNDCANFIEGEFGVKPAPIFRPPYGYYDDRVLREAAAGGYHSCVMWYGSLGDGSNITASERLKLARTWMTAGHVVIGHANQPTAPADLLKIRQIIDSRGLRTVTLDDIWRS